MDGHVAGTSLEATSQVDQVAYLMATVLKMRSYAIERPTQEEVEEKLAAGTLSPDEDWFRLDPEVIMYAASHWELAE